MAPEPFRLKVGLLPDLSVDPGEELALRRSRWSAVVRVGLPDWFSAADEIGLANFVDAHLRGRGPMTGSYSEGLLVSFKVPDDGDGSRLLAEALAQGFTQDEVFGSAAFRNLAVGISFTDTSAYEHLLPEDMRQISS